jgi:hypothetical protein
MRGAVWPLSGFITIPYNDLDLQKKTAQCCGFLVEPIREVKQVFV